MKRIISQIMLTMAATAAIAQNDNAATAFVNENEAEITSYFTAKLDDKDGEFSQYGGISLDAVPAARAAVWDVWKKTVNNYEEEKLIPLGDLEDRNVGKWKLPASLEPNAVMPYYFGINRNNLTLNGRKLPLFLYMHGSGDKNSEWETGIGLSLHRFYNPGVYMVPQIPNTGEYYRWAIQSKQWAWEKLLRLAFLNDTIDANRIYFFGISEGGYGSQRLASFYADYLAGAGPMAGGEPLKNAPMENLANIAFSLRTGADDTGFGRNILTQKALETANELEAAHPGYYNHFIEVIPGYGHGIDYAPTTPWLAKYKRNPHPKYFYWENYEMYGRYRDCFYNLRVNETSSTNANERSCYEMSIDNNVVTLNIEKVKYTTTYSLGGIEMYFSKQYTNAKKGNVTLFLNEELFDLSQPVKIILNGEEIFNSTVSTNIKTLIESCALFYDPERLFPAAIDIDIYKKSAVVTSVDKVKDVKKKSGKTYDLSGRPIEQPLKGDIYISDGKKILK